MFKKLMKHLTNNLGLKFLSILFSLVLWLVVVIVADPKSTKTFTVPVEIMNKNVITEMGKVPDIVNGTEVATFSISGQRSYVDKMSAEDFSAVADMSQVDLTQAGDVKLVPIEVTAKKYDKWITITRKTVNMQITLEDLSEQKFVISGETMGTPADGCAIGEVEVTPNLLKISGPESVVSRISKVSATINVDGISSDVSDNVMPVLYDEDGEVISSDLLEMNRTTVTIRVNILGTKRVSIRCDVSGTPAEGYEYRGIEYAPETVLIKGEAAILNRISSIKIPEDVIDISGATGDIDTVIDITPYLEEGVALADDSANQVAVKVIIEQKETRIFNIQTKDIIVSGLNEDYEISYNDITLPVSVRALQENMNLLEVSQIQAELDVSELTPGSHLLEVQITLPDERFEVIGVVRVQVMIKDKNAPEDEQEDGTEPGTDPDDTEGTGTGNTGNTGNTGGTGTGNAEGDNTDTAGNNEEEP